ncbi:MAG: lysylphosphatidylglycerol synthase domain-containing protein, partial [Bacteroidota bacterium]
MKSPFFIAKKKLIAFSVKLLIAVLVAWALYRQVFAKQELDEIYRSFQVHFRFPNLLWLVAVVLLAPVNLGFEALKFRQLIRSFSSIGFWKTYRAILAGVAIAIFTPNRVGEYGGRVLFVEREHGWKAVVATMVGSMSQLLVLLSVGLVGAGYFSWRFLQPEPYVLAMAICLGLLLVSLLLFGFFNIDLLVPVAKRIPHIDKFRKYLRHLDVLKNYTARELGGALGFAFLRYLTYSTQYFFLLQFFEIPAAWLPGMAGIAAIFLVQASIPLPPVMGLLARSEIALFVWGFFSQDQVGILAASFSLFLINIAVPA